MALLPLARAPVVTVLGASAAARIAIAAALFRAVRTTAGACTDAGP
ncbi:MAG: hypothetical protein IPM29_00730 [Planctomycetes bacterium]|nr:hypothetical protein [Planctomycetota bacterium]